MRDNNKLLKTIDKLILFFYIIFLLSLTVSIFVNQLGYYSALLLIIMRYFISREKTFVKSGLELPLVLFIGAEILSALFSDYSSLAFVNVIKRSLLIPIIYLTIIVAENYDRAKLIFKIYMAASLATVLIYLFFSYKHFLQNLYPQEESGPGLFQYPITSSEIMGFTVIYFFAFFINEKTNLRNKLLLFAGFALSALAVFATYKRTGWLAIAGGIFVILILKKQWKILIPAVILCIAVVLSENDVSNIHIYRMGSSSLDNEEIQKTGGRANSLTPMDKYYLLSDFENGLIRYEGTKITGRNDFPAPVVAFSKWVDNYYYARLVDTRLVLMKKEDDRFFNEGTFLTRGVIQKSASVGEYLYILDTESGLTIFRNPGRLTDSLSLNKFKGYYDFFADSLYFIFRAPDKIEIYNNYKGIPGNLVHIIKPSKTVTSIYYIDKNIFISGSAGTENYILEDSLVSYKGINSDAKNILKWQIPGSNLYAIDRERNLHHIEMKTGAMALINKKYQLSFMPQDFIVQDSSLILLELKKSRIASIVDPYHPSNFVRFALWRAGFEIFKDYPILGVGDIDLQNYYKKYKRDFDKEIQGHMHNNFMHILVTLGLLGLGVVIFLFIKILLIDFKIYNFLKNEAFYSSYALGTIGAFVAFLIAGLTELNFGDHEIITLVWFTFGLNYFFYNFTKKNKEAHN